MNNKISSLSIVSAVSLEDFTIMQLKAIRKNIVKIDILRKLYCFASGDD